MSGKTLDQGGALHASGNEGTSVGKRGRREGTIYQRESAGRWVACVHLGYENGRRERTYIVSQWNPESRN